MLTLKDFEEAVEHVQKAAIKTELIYSDYLSEQTGKQGLSETGESAEDGGI